MFNLFRGRSLKKVLGATKKIRVKGVNFTIKKINTLDYLTGSKILLSSYETYNTKNAKADIHNATKKIKEHYTDMFMLAVVKPSLMRKDDESSEKIFVGEILTDWEMASALYSKILEFSFGKKKLKELFLLGQN